MGGVHIVVAGGKCDGYPSGIGAMSFLTYAKISW
jgi:hypothetical protein